MNILYSQHSVERKRRFQRFYFFFFVAIFFTIFNSFESYAQPTNGLPSYNELKKLSVEDLMNIEVTSVSKHPEKLTEVASAIQVITSEDIRRSGATSVPEALKLASNLQVAQVNASQWAISARGFNNVLANKLLVLIDGRTVYTPMYAGVFWDVQNLLLEDVDRIEVISGPGGTLWGSNAVNGVINIITKSSKKTQGLFVEAGGGNQLQGYGGLRYGGRITKDISYRVYGTTFKKNSTVLYDGSSAADEWTMAQGGFRVDWDAKKNNLLSLQSNLYSNRPDPDGNNPIVASGSNILGRWTKMLSEESDLQLQAYYDQTWRDFRNGFTEDLKTYDLYGQHRFRLGRRQGIVWGFGARLMDHEVHNLELFGFSPENKLLQLYNVFIQDDITLIKERLRLTIGTKIEHNSYTGYQDQPNVRVTWTPTARQTVWAAVSQAFRTPARVDREFFIEVAPNVPIIAGSDIVGLKFVSEKVLAYELGWRLQPVESISFSASTFYNIYDNIRSAEPGNSPPPYPISLGNGVHGDTYGIELAGTYQPIIGFRLRGGYTFLKKDLSVKSTSSDLNGGTAESDDPQQQFLIQPMIDLPGHIELGAVLRYIDVLPKPHVPGYTGLDIRIGWKINKVFELNLVGQNLMDDSHAEFIPSSPAPRKIQRGVYGKIVCRF